MSEISKLRFAFDLGTNSIGWAVYSLEERGAGIYVARELQAAGVRLFEDGRNPKDGRSLAEMRRVPRAARRRRDRFVERRAELVGTLVDLGLMPSDEGDRRKLVHLDPYALRAKGLDQRLEPHELGRALFHINQRRGFKSNRRADRKSTEKGKIKEATDRLRSALSASGSRTFGEFLWLRHGGADGHATPRTRRGVRIRLEGAGANALYDFYPTREILMDEFHRLIKSQALHHPALLSPEAISELSHTIFYQRPLKAPPVGRCLYEPQENRLPKALPSVEARVLYEALNHLRYGQGLSLKTPLTREQRDLLASNLLQGYAGTKISFDKIRTAFHLPTGSRFSLEEAGKKDLKDFSSKSAAAMGSKSRFGARWHGLPLAERDAIVLRLINEDDEETLAGWLKIDYGLSDEEARAVTGWAPNDGTSRLGRTANAAILTELSNDHLCTYSDAVVKGGEKLGKDWHHSDSRDGEIHLPLPYYGRLLERHVIPPSIVADSEKSDEKRFGRLPNPTVHIALGQLRRLVNALVRAHGEPEQIVVELARELKLNAKQKEDEQKRNNQNRKDNDARRVELTKQNIPDTAENRLRLRLFQEQQRANGGVAMCPYSLKPIGLEKLFSSEIDIDHILPYSRTLDDTSSNRIVCYRDANRLKRAKSPFEALGSSSNWEAIVTAANGLPRNKSWRFGPDAMERFENKERDFLARQINETRHLSKLARTYLGAACGPDNVYVTTGQLTAMLRARWGLNSILRSHNQERIEGEKNRNDHRHHAVDACVIGAIDRSLLQEMSRLAGQAEVEDRIDITRNVPDPFPGFRDAVRDKVNSLVVSVKPEHGVTGALHEDTAYGLINDPDEAAQIGNLVYRKPVADLNLNEIERVRDPVMRTKLKELARPFLDTDGKLTNEKAFTAALAAFTIPVIIGGNTIQTKVRRVRIGKAKSGEVHIKDRRTGSVYKALLPGENHHIDIVQMRDGVWRGFAATVFEVNQPDWRPQWERDKLGGKLVMRVHKGDSIEVDDTDGVRRIKTVHRLEISASRVRLVPHNEGGEVDKRHKDESDSLRWDLATFGRLKERNARKVVVDVIGRVKAARSNVQN